MDPQAAHWLALGALAVFQGVTVWAWAATRGKLAQLRASIPPDTSKQLDELTASVKAHGEKIDDTHRRITNAEKAQKYAGEALVTAARRLGAN